jgi:hypothetical protein
MVTKHRYVLMKKILRCAQDDIFYSFLGQLLRILVAFSLKKSPKIFDFKDKNATR